MPRIVYAIFLVLGSCSAFLTPNTAISPISKLATTTCNPALVALKGTPLGNKIVQETTAMLPNADSIGHMVLHANELLVNSLMNNKELAISIKKPLILFLIQLVQSGDDGGSTILSNYHHLVDCLL